MKAEKKARTADANIRPTVPAPDSSVGPIGPFAGPALSIEFREVIT